MKRFLIIFLLLPILAACRNSAVEDDAQTPLSGPSLVMFYTDN